jgi:drug/metabolite transporter (DMT)-like permease
MILLLIAILFYVGIFVTFKLFSRYNISNFTAIMINYLVASLTGLLAFGGFSKLGTIINAPWIWVAVIIGILFVIVFYLFAICSQKLSVTMTAMSSKMSVVIPVFALLYLFNDAITPLKIAGLVLVILSLYLIMKPDEKTRIDKKYLFIPISIFIGAGVSDTLFGYAKRTFEITSSTDSALFVSTIFGISFILGIIIFPFTIKRGKPLMVKADLIGGFALGIINFLAVFFFTYAQGYFQASVFFPIFNVGVVALSALTGLIFFKERLNKYNYIGLAISLIAIALINI